VLTRLQDAPGLPAIAVLSTAAGDTYFYLAGQASAHRPLVGVDLPKVHAPAGIFFPMVSAMILQNHVARFTRRASAATHALRSALRAARPHRCSAASSGTMRHVMRSPPRPWRQPGRGSGGSGRSRARGARPCATPLRATAVLSAARTVELPCPSCLRAFALARLDLGAVGYHAFSPLLFAATWPRRVRLRGGCGRPRGSTRR
jgi:hypothetical protein